MNGPVRSFVSISIPATIREEIGVLQRKLKPDCGDVKWVRPESLHITLKFLGNVEHEQIDALHQALKKAVSGIKPFTAILKDLGRFPASGMPRIIWIGIHDGAEDMKHLASAVDASLHLMGFDREKRPFSPHLTIGRVKRAGRNIGEAMRGIKYSSEPVNVADIHLMRSELHPAGARYSVIHSIQLKG